MHVRLAPCYKHEVPYYLLTEGRITNNESLDCIFSKRDSLIIFKDNLVGA